MKLTQLLSAVGLLALGACATKPAIPDRAILLGQVAYVAQSGEATTGFRYVAQTDDALNGVLPSSRNVPPAQELITSCSAEHDDDARFALVRFYYYEVGRSAPLHDISLWTMVGAGLPVARGNLVEVDLHRGSSKSECRVINRVRAANIGAAGCQYHGDEEGALFSVMDMVSGQASASLYCPFYEEEGWKATAIGVMGGLAWWKAPAAAVP